MENMKDRIKKVRKELDFTQEKFADKIGISQNAVALIEAGKRNPSSQTLLSICREFHINEKWLRNGEGEMFAPQEIEDYLNNPDLDPIDKAILKAYINAPSELRVYIKNKIMEIASLQEQQKPRIVEEPEIDLTRPDGLSDSEWDLIVKKRTAEVGQKKAAS